MQHTLTLICTDPDGNRVLSIRHYSDHDPRERIRELERLSKRAKAWRKVGYPVAIIEDDREEIGLH